MNELATNQKFLFVHQSANQHYGNHICLLDATYKTTRYSISLYFLVIKTNLDYQIIGSFATQDETSETLVEALSIIKLWKPFQNWKPICFMVDN